MRILKIGAAWCNGCVVMKPRFAEIEKENPELETKYYEYDESPEIIEKYNVGDEVPVFIFLDKNGNELERFKGIKEKNEILDLIEKYKDK